MAIDKVALNNFASLNDNGIRYLAKEKTLHDVNDKKHRILDRALYMLIPTAGAVAAAATPTITRPTRLDRVFAAGKGFGAWFVPLAVGYGVAKTLGVAEKNSQKLSEFNKKHPILSSIGFIGSAFAGLAGALKLGSVLNAKYGQKVLNTFSPQIIKFTNYLEKSTVLNFASIHLKNMNPTVKGFSKSALNFAPWALFAASILHSMGHQSKKAAQYQKNYYELKNAQVQVQNYIGNADIINDEL